MIFSFSQSKCEDDASLSSTLTVGRAQIKLLAVEDDDRSISTCSVAFKKAVRFNLADNQEYENTQISKEDCSELWFSASESKHFKAYTHAIAREIIQFESRNYAPFSYERVLGVLVRAFNVCCNTTPTETFASPLSVEERRHMKRWAEVAPSRVGLEKWAVKHIGLERSRRRSDMVNAVLLLQQTLEGDDLDELIRRHSERVSLPSRLFAHCIAQAQATVIHCDMLGDA